MRRVLLGIVLVLLTISFILIIPTGLPEGMFHNEFAPWYELAQETKPLGFILHLTSMLLLIYTAKRYPKTKET